jgi:carboxyl-terminal processing protease
MSPTDGPSRVSIRRLAGAARVLRAIALVMLVAVSTGFGIAIGTSFDASDGATASTRLTTMPEFEVLEETYDAIRENYVLSDEVTDEQLMHGAATGMVESLGDTNHSAFLDPTEADEFARSLESELIGIGVQIDLTGPLPVIIAPIDGSPAWEAGIRPGDVIISVDGVESERRDPAEVTDLISGEEGTDVTLVLRHRNSDETYEVTITRSKIVLEPVSFIMMPDNVLWLRIARFSSGTTEGVREALEWGKDNGMTGVVLDLRNNPGGYTSEAMGVGAQFLPAGSVLYKEQLSDGSIIDQTIDLPDGAWLDGDMVVLINGGSASAAEIVASGLRDNDRATLYGETTVGTGTVLNGYTLSDGSMALLGTKLWLTADGSEIWKLGVEPDVEVTHPIDELPSLPMEFEGEQISAEQLAATEDVLLLAGFGAITGAEQPVATPAA